MFEVQRSIFEVRYRDVFTDVRQLKQTAKNIAATRAFLIQRAYTLPLISTNGEYNLFSPVDSDRRQPEAVFRQLEASVRDLEAILRHLEAISDLRKLLLSGGTNLLNGLSCLLFGEVFNLTCNKHHRNTVG